MTTALRPHAATPKAEQTRRRIMAAALDLFQERGFAATTMRDIAERADAATGAAYYYFPSKEAIVMAFYWQMQLETDSAVERLVRSHRDLRGRLQALVGSKLEQLSPYRSFLGTLFRSAADPSSPLSPFGEETREIRERSVGAFRRALTGSDVKVPADLAEHLPFLLWLYQMGVFLFWISDRSPRQSRTQRLVDRTCDLIVRLIRLSRLPIFKPFRNGIRQMLVDIQ